MKNPQDVAKEFADLFSRFEHVLKRSGCLKNREDAQADWEKFAGKLDAAFFEYLQESEVADTLINDPPRKLMRDGLQWLPEKPEPLSDVKQLFTRGVCRVRNNYLHGEKFTGGPDHQQGERDCRLLSEALAVLYEAINFLPAEMNEHAKRLRA